MNLYDLIVHWLAEHHPDVKVAESRALLPIKSKYLGKLEEGDVWYVFRIMEDKVLVFNPAQKKFGASIAASLPTFFEELNAVVEFYKSYP